MIERAVQQRLMFQFGNQESWNNLISFLIA